MKIAFIDGAAGPDTSTNRQRVPRDVSRRGRWHSLALRARWGAALALGALLLAGCAPRAGSVTPKLSASAADPTFLERFAVTNRFRCGKPGSITTTPDGSAVLFLRSGPRDFAQDLYESDAVAGTERVILTASALLGDGTETLSAEEKARRERARQSARGITSFQLSEDGKTLLVPLSGRLFVVDRKSGAVRELKPSVEKAPPPLDPRLSPDASKVAFVRAGDLWVVDVASGTETQLTSGATDTLTRGDAEFVAQEEMDRRHGFWWSPDSKQIAYQETDTSGVELVYIMDPLKPYVAAQSWRYPRPGKANAKVRVGVVSASGGETRWIGWEVEKYPYLATVKWDKNSPLTMLVMNRAQTEAVLMAVNPEGASSTTLLVERDAAWVELDQSMPKWLSDGRSFLWTTEKNGAKQLTLRSADGTLISEVTPLSMGFRSMVALDEARREVIVSASSDPTQSQLYRVALDPGSGQPAMLTPGQPGQHSAVVSKDGNLSVHVYSPLEGRQTITMHKRDDNSARLGAAIAGVASVAEPVGFEPQLELTTAGSHISFHAALIRPRDFKRGQKYPVIASVYAGPTAQTVSAVQDAYVFQQWVADHGFIVVSIDNRGTPGRGHDWERCIKGDLISMQLADQVDALQALGRAYPELDMERIGVYGWSFGGYFSQMAAMQRPDIYKAACAGAPVTDWADYDTFYTERYLSTPELNPEGYKTSNCLTYAERLSVPLLIIHGTADDNVYFTHSLRMTDALLRAGRPFEFLPLAGFTHMVSDPKVVVPMYERMMAFFVENLKQEKRE